MAVQGRGIAAALSAAALSAAALSGLAVLSTAALSACKITTSGLRTTHTASASAAASTGTTGAASNSTGAPSGTASAANATTGEQNPMYDEKGFIIARDDPPGTQHQKPLKSIDRRELETLLGLTADQARQRLKEIGHTGAVRVATQEEEDRRCRPNTVCMTYPSGGLMESQEITLYLNGKFKIAPPPP
jgi:hypothetical protein